MSDADLGDNAVRPDRSGRYVLITIAVTAAVEICALLWLFRAVLA